MLTDDQRQQIDADLHRLAVDGPVALEDALRRTLTALHELAGEKLDVTPTGQQHIAVALADIRDLSEGRWPADPADDVAGRLRVDVNTDTPRRLALVASDVHRTGA